METWEKQSAMLGYALHIRRLEQEDLDTWPDLRDAMIEYEVPPEECIAVVGEDLGQCLAAVIHMDAEALHPLVWSDADGEGNPIISNANQFADSVAYIVSVLVPGFKVI